MDTSTLSPSQARLKLTIINKQAEAKNSYELHADMKDMGLPDEVIEILEQILRVTSKVAGKAISIGKIIVVSLLEYAKKHPLQVAGLALGLGATYAIGLAVHSLFAVAPAVSHWFGIGPLLAKLVGVIAGLFKTVAMPVMVAAPLVGVVAGEMLDRKFPIVSQSVKEIAEGFFELFSQIINSLKDEFDFGQTNQAYN
ncbi:hypothetical protein [Pseudanabaena sp. FACHB-2040]|uniref:hypothetical protein n=1 Tax=Pseudanabaena sp. FACHB-2040 TaxID=2692859 RepID=UPI001685681D|nr:hypothetical protein [Pseudanabaena sp. FACHB-2040]MBD2261150.1 hypothetical protein [Pseudanabaena sp. FACHB-2040]